MNIPLTELIRAINGRLISGSSNGHIAGVSIDSRTLQAGQAFFALRGPRFDGHDFLKAANTKGAAALVVQNAPADLRGEDRTVIQVSDTLRALQDLARAQRRNSQAKVIGITGSNGKTTTKEMVAAILRKVGATLATAGNLNNHIGLPLTVAALSAEHRFAVIEMGTSKPGDMRLLVDLAKPQVGLITNVGKDHLEFLGSEEGVLQENRSLFDGLPIDGVAVVNLDDDFLRPLAGTLSSRVVTYGWSERADVRAARLKAWPLPLEFDLLIRGKTYRAQLSVPGAVQVSNALAAAAVAHAIGISPDLILAGLASFQPAAMRMQMQKGLHGAVLLNDAYNANPSSVRASVDSFCQGFAGQPRWLVLGDMRELGGQAREEHRALGFWLAEKSLDRIFLYGRDTRFVWDALSEAKAPMKFERFRKKRYLIEELKQTLSAKPAVLFKASRSIKLEQVITPLLAGTPASAGH